MLLHSFAYPHADGDEPCRSGKEAGACGRRDPERTRAAILEAAIVEFATRGLGGARVSRIAERACTNKRMLYHYFGNKEALYLAALEAVYETIRGKELALDVDHMPPDEGMRALVRTVWQQFLEHPEFISLLNSENLHRARYLARSKRVPALQSPLVEMIARLLRRGAEAGLFRPGIDPAQLYLSIASLAYFCFSNRHTLAISFGIDILDQDALDQRLAHITELVMRYLEARAPEPPAAPAGAAGS